MMSEVDMGRLIKVDYDYNYDGLKIRITIMIVFFNYNYNCVLGVFNYDCLTSNLTSKLSKVNCPRLALIIYNYNACYNNLGCHGFIAMLVLYIKYSSK